YHTYFAHRRLTRPSQSSKSTAESRSAEGRERGTHRGAGRRTGRIGRCSACSGGPEARAASPTANPAGSRGKDLKIRMRRFRVKRGMTAVALVPVAAAITLTATAPSFGEAERKAKLGAKQHQVKVGKRVTLRGKFPDAPNTAIDIRFRPAGAKA